MEAFVIARRVWAGECDCCCEENCEEYHGWEYDSRLVVLAVEVSPQRPWAEFQKHLLRNHDSPGDGTRYMPVDGFFSDLEAALVALHAVQGVTFRFTEAREPVASELQTNKDLYLR